jgi:hypothetical protein
MDRTLFGLSDPGGSYAAGQLAGWPNPPSAGGGFGGILSNLGPKWGQLSSIFSDPSSDPWQGMMRAAASGGVPSGGDAWRDAFSLAGRAGQPAAPPVAAQGGYGADSSVAAPSPAAPPVAVQGGYGADSSVAAPSPAAASTARPDLRRAMMAGQPLRSAFGGWGRA